MISNRMIRQAILELQEIVTQVFHSIFWQSPEFILENVPIDNSSENPLLFRILQKDKSIERAKIFLKGEPWCSQEDSTFALMFRTFWKSVMSHQQNRNMSTGRSSGKIAKSILESLSEYETVSTYPNFEDLAQKYKDCKSSIKPCAACASCNTLIVEYTTHSDFNGTIDTWEIYCCECKYTSIYYFNDRT